MAYEDKTLVCAECSNEFAFTAGEQEFYAEKQLTSEPKRCKQCRRARKQAPKKRSRQNQEYRAPAFGDSAPRRQGRNEFDQGKSDYRSPAFREQDAINPAEEYRSPAFREQDAIKPEDEYRSPGFHEYDNIDLKEEYRSPGFHSTTEEKTDKKPLFSIVCAKCNNEAMVPFLPEEKEVHYCQDCFAAIRAAERKARLAAEAEEQMKARAEKAALEENPAPPSVSTDSESE